ncbi:MAG: hypothetical protein LBM96_02305 [Methanobrevibacter sp.]|jgi:hypothetical protein|nr:hypothetical protein [Candidatus Methanoflexus mossambicus]
MKFITKSIPIKSNILKDINQIAKKNGTNEDDLIKELVNTGLSKKVENLKTENIEEKVNRLSNGRLKVVKPKLSENFLKEYKNLKTDDLIGIGVVPESEIPFDPVKAVNEIYFIN